MLTARLSWRYLWSVVSACLTAGVLLLGCTPEEALQPPQPPQPSAEVSKRLAALEECAARSQRAVTAAADVGVSTGALAPLIVALLTLRTLWTKPKSWPSRASTKKLLSG